MNVEFTGRNLVITDDVRSFAEDKLSRLERHSGRLDEVHVILTAEKHRLLCDIVARGPHLTLTAAEETDDLYAAIAQAVDKLTRQADRQKGSRVARRRGNHRGLPLVEEPPTASEPALPQVIPTKPGSLKPMTVEEAALQIEVATDSFLVFRNAESQRISIVYRRADGNLGLIDPET
jgi:putative sigma-54 modulation protein